MTRTLGLAGLWLLVVAVCAANALVVAAAGVCVDRNRRTERAAHRFVPKQSLRSPYYTKLVPDWNETKVIPKPCDSFLVRMSAQIPPSDKPPCMKVVSNMWRHFKQKFQGDPLQSWDQHID